MIETDFGASEVRFLLCIPDIRLERWECTARTARTGVPSLLHIWEMRELRPPDTAGG
jgi:hypothetical protein